MLVVKVWMYGAPSESRASTLKRRLVLSYSGAAGELRDPCPRGKRGGLVNLGAINTASFLEGAVFFLHLGCPPLHAWSSAT